LLLFTSNSKLNQKKKRQVNEAQTEQKKNTKHNKIVCLKRSELLNENKSHYILINILLVLLNQSFQPCQQKKKINKRIILFGSCYGYGSVIDDFFIRQIISYEKKNNNNRKTYVHT
jgi:hypothetical protein